MRIWILPALFAMFWMPQLFPEKEIWPDSDYDLFMFESENGDGMAVVTMDPFFDETGWAVKVWRADVHMRVGTTTVHEEILFRAKKVERDTLVFVETAWGTELHIYEAHPDMGPDATRRRRWAARTDGLEELHPVRGHGPFT